MTKRDMTELLDELERADRTGWTWEKTENLKSQIIKMWEEQKARIIKHNIDLDSCRLALHTNRRLLEISCERIEKLEGALGEIASLGCSTRREIAQKALKGNHD